MKLKILYLVSMPIGHLDDISKRGWETLQNVPTIILEEYRTGKKILDQLGIDLNGKKILELNEHVESSQLLKKNRFPAKSKAPNHSRFSELLKTLLDSPAAALMSDAGAPILADPGFRLVEEIRVRNIPITHISGASSLISGLLLSGFSLNRFYYIGFLPQNHTMRNLALKKLLSHKELLVIMETPYRLSQLLLSLIRIFPNQTPVAITFAMSSDQEEVFHGNLDEAVARYAHAEKNRRPFVLFLNNRNRH